jgi:hypothetical protein
MGMATTGLTIGATPGACGGELKEPLGRKLGKMSQVAKIDVGVNPE